MYSMLISIKIIEKNLRFNQLFRSIPIEKLVTKNTYVKFFFYERKKNRFSMMHAY
jgi:hypothetical protein